MMDYAKNPQALLYEALASVAARQRSLRLWRNLAICWAGGAVLGLMLILAQQQIGRTSALALPFVALGTIVVAGALWFRQSRTAPDFRELARQIEARHPELDGRLLTAVQQHATDDRDLNFLQGRVVEETLVHSRKTDWSEIVPASRLGLAKLAHVLGLIFFCLVLPHLRTSGGVTHLLAKIAGLEMTVSPGDATIERGSSLVVLARFSEPPPARVDLVIGAASQTVSRIPLVKSLADPMFGGSVMEVATNLVYHVEYSGSKTRDFTVKVFDYPRLERADADVKFPDYTRQPPKRIEDTRRVSAVEGSTLDLELQLNKLVASAQLVSKDKDRTVVPLLIETNRPATSLRQFALTASKSYELQLVDAEGRTNKVPAQFVFEALKNRAPEIHLASPRGDLRPSPLEEISFEGTVWDDFGVRAYGLGYTKAGEETTFVELGQAVPGKEKRAFQHVLRLEELNVHADQLLAWFAWADDTGPDGATRRTTTDLFFAEIRPFEEIFREGQAMEGQQAGAQPGSQTSKLAELQKQIINATWRLQRDHGPSGSAPEPRAPRPQDLKSSERSDHAQPATAFKSAFIRSGTSRQVFGLLADSATDAGPSRSRGPYDKSPGSKSATHPKYEEDAGVVHDSQEQALKQAQAAAQRQQDPRTEVLWNAAIKEMEQALARLGASTNTPAKLGEALASEQAAYQALLKLQQHEYQVSRSSRSPSGGGRDQQLQRQLEQMDMTQAEDRYETQRKAQRQQPSERGEQLQVMNRLQELARRQQDLNDRLKELQTALQEARTETQREEIKRRLKRLQEEEQQMLADVDELRQRMERPENQSRMAEEKRQLDETRNDVQRAAEAAEHGTPSQALASGTRAQRQLQEMRDQMRKDSSSQFSDELRDLRAQARELARQQAEISKKMETDATRERRSLSDSTERKEVVEQLARQKELMTNLVERATEVSQQAEGAEPLLSRQLYDTVREFNQKSAKNVKEAQDELLNQGLLTRTMLEHLNDASITDGAKLLDMTSEMVRQDFTRPAASAGERARAGIEDLKRGVERAADSVLGDDTEALRLAQKQLDDLTDQLQNEMAQAQGRGSGTNEGPAQAGLDKPGENNRTRQPGRGQPAGEQASSESTDQKPDVDGEGKGTSEQSGSPGDPSKPVQGAQGKGAQASLGQAQKPGEPTPSETAQQSGRPGGNSPGAANDPSQTGQPGRDGQSRNQAAQRTGRNNGASANWGDGGNGGNLARDWDRILGGNDDPLSGPITGGGFAPWSDGLRNVEEMIDAPDLRNEVAKVRERARLMRQEFKRDAKKPDWAVVRLQIVKPLTEIRDRIADELARRGSNDALVPIDRDPVPARYSDLVRKYYEELGKEK